jgi:hypothetical protein
LLLLLPPPARLLLLLLPLLPPPPLLLLAMMVLAAVGSASVSVIPSASVVQTVASKRPPRLEVTSRRGWQDARYRRRIEEGKAEKSEQEEDEGKEEEGGVGVFVGEG